MPVASPPHISAVMMGRGMRAYDGTCFMGRMGTGLIGCVAV